MADVFLSYVPLDIVKASQVATGLTRAGFTVSWEHDLPPGDYEMAMQQQLTAAGVVIVLLSPDSVKSERVLSQARHGSERRIAVPVFVETPVQVPPLFGSVERFNLQSWDRDPTDAEFRRLAGYIGRLLSGPNAPMPSDNVSPAAVQRARNRTSTPREQSAQVFICYRRDDTQHAADRLHERLVQAYGSDRVFMDVDSVPLGVNFVSYISEQLQRCAVVLVIIGPHWMKIVDDEGHRRLDDPADHVRVEIAAALSHGVPVIPLMVQDAPMPKAKDLPANIRELANQNGMPMPRAYWKESLERLIKKLEPLMLQPVRPALASKAPTDSVNPLSAIHRLVESRDNRRLLICYPEDARLWATRIYDRVVAAHGFRAVFRLRDAHAPGPEDHTLDVSATRAAIVLLTPRALEPAATGGNDDEFYETVTVLLKADIPAIPVLIHGAAFPAPALVPEAIRPLAAMNAIRLEHTDWAVGAKQLLKELKPLMA